MSNIVKMGQDEFYNMIMECVKKSVNEIMDANNMAESFFDSNNFHPMEKKESDNKDDSKGLTKRRQRVISRLKDDGVDVAQYAYKLWPEKDEDACRSYFYKCLNGEENDDGVPYRFDDNEVNRLYSMLSNDSI